MNVLPRFVRQHPITSVLAACFFVIALVAIRNLTRPEQDPKFLAIRQGGYPVTLAELNDFYGAVPEDQNAALLYQQAFELDLFTNNAYDDLTGKLVLERGQPMPEEIRGNVAAAMAGNARAWQLLYSATNDPGSRYPIDLRQGSVTALPQLAKVKRATTLLTLESLSHASKGDSNQAYAALNAALHAGDSLREEPVLISFLVRIACSALAAKRLEMALNLVAFDEQQLRSLQEQFAAADDPRWAARALAGERALGLAFFIDPQTQRSFGQQQGSGGGPLLGGQLALAAYRMSGLMARDKAFYLDAMARNVARAELRADERVKSGPTPALVVTNRFLILSRMMLPALQRVLDRADEQSARMRVVETALAVERWRVSHGGALPGSLEQLAPNYLLRIPLDPYDSNPLRYKKLPRGYVVYSIGADQKDDGGAEPPPPDKSGKRAKSTAPDVTFVVERQ